MNITEKILSAKAGHEVTPGEIIEIPVDLAMSHDGTSPPAIKTFEKIADKIRSELDENGILLNDSKEGTSWDIKELI